MLLCQRRRAQKLTKTRRRGISTDRPAAEAANKFRPAYFVGTWSDRIGSRKLFVLVSIIVNSS